MLVIGAGNSMLFSLLPPLMRRLELPDSGIGWIFSLSALLWAFTSPYWGRVSDRAGRKPIIASGLMAYAVSMGLFALVAVLGLIGWIEGATVFFGLMLTRAIFGAFGSAASPAAQAYIADHTSLTQRTEELAALTAAFALGQAIGPAFCAALATQTGLVFPIVLISAIAGFASFSILRFLPDGGPPAEKPAASASAWSQSLKLALDPRLSGFLIFGFGLSAVNGTTAQVFSLFTMDRLGVSGTAGAEMSAAGFMVMALSLLTTQMALLPRLKLSARALMASGIVLVGLGLLLQLIAGNLGMLLTAQMLQGLGLGLARPGFTGGASMAVQPSEQGGAAGLVVAMNGAGFVLSPLTGGVAYELLGMNAPLWLSLLMLAGMLAFVLRSRRLRNATPVEAPPNDPTPA